VKLVKKVTEACWKVIAFIENKTEATMVSYGSNVKARRPKEGCTILSHVMII